MGESLFFDLFLILFIGFSIGFDVWEKRIPNRLVLLGLIGGILFSAFKGLPQLIESILGLGLGAGILILPFALRWLGAGDVKFFGALGAILGVKWVPRIFFYSALLGGLLALIVIVLGRGINLKAFRGAWLDVKLFIMSLGVVRPKASGEARKKVITVPYGVAIGLGTLVAFYVDPKGEWAGF